MESKARAALSGREMELGPQAPTPAIWQHWRLAMDEDNIEWLLFDRKGTSVNSLSREVLSELDAALSVIERNAPKGLVIRSAKPSGFIAGADINEFSGAQFGFPEVMLGLHPGLGGTVRSTHLVNPLQAMSLMLTGRSIDARKAKTLGLADAVTEERHVRNAVKAAASGVLKARRASPFMLALLNAAPVRQFAARRMRARTGTRARPEHYPAPYALIDLWERHGGHSTAMLHAETASFARLAVTETAQNLIRLFFLRDELKKAAGKAEDIRRVHVIGAGAMGGDIAAWCAYQGLR